MAEANGSVEVTAAAGDSTQHNDIELARSLARRNAAHEQTFGSMVRSSFLTDASNQGIELGGDHRQPRDGKSKRKSVDHTGRAVSRDDMLKQAKAIVKDSLPGGLTMNAKESSKYFGTQSKLQFFKQCGSLTRNRVLNNTENATPMSAELTHSLDVVHNMHNHTVNTIQLGNPDDTSDPNGGVPFNPFRHSMVPTNECAVNTRVIIRNQTLQFEEGYTQMKLITKPSYVVLDQDLGHSSEEEAAAAAKRPLKRPALKPPTPVKKGVEISVDLTDGDLSSQGLRTPPHAHIADGSVASSGGRLSLGVKHNRRRVKPRALPAVMASPAKSTSKPSDTPGSKPKRLPPIQAETIISNIETMYQSLLFSSPARPTEASISTTESHGGDVDRLELHHSASADTATSAPTTAASAPLKGPVTQAPHPRGHQADAATSTKQTTLSPQQLGGVGAGSNKSNTKAVISVTGDSLRRAASMQKSLSRLNSSRSMQSSPKRGSGGAGGFSRRATGRGAGASSDDYFSTTELGELYAQFKQELEAECQLPPEPARQEHGDVHDPHAKDDGERIQFICIEHRDANNKNLMPPKRAGRQRQNGFTYVDAKLVKDFTARSYELEPQDAYEYNELDTDLEIDLWGHESSISPAKLSLLLLGDSGGEKNQDHGQNNDTCKDGTHSGNGGAIVLSPRSLYIDSCLRNRLNPRANLLLRKQFTRELNLKHLGMGDEMAVLLAEALVHVPYITSVNICDNNLTDTGLSAIVHSIVHMHEVSHLNMSFNEIGPDAASALAHYLSSSTCALEFLILQKADVDDDECGNFVAALHHNTSLKELDLSENKVGSNENLNTVMPDIVTGGEALAELLRSERCPLATLKLGWNLIRLGGAEDLCSSLSENQSITDLDLSFNSLGSAAGIQLGDALQDNQVLKRLSIANNSLDSIACLTICAGILQNKNLEYVNFDGNPIAEQGAKALMLLPTIVGSRVYISARSCNISLQDSNNWFDTAMMTRPYELDLSQPFHRAIAIILTHLIPSHQTYIVAKSEYLDTQNPGSGFVTLALQETVVEDTKHLEPEQLKEIEGFRRIREATKDVRKAVALFQEVDKDGSGELDEEEFGCLMETLGMSLDEGKVKEVMSEYDVDGGGIIEMHEFLLFLRNQQKDAGKRLRELTEFPILISGLQYNLPAPAFGAAQLVSSHTPTASNNASALSLTSSVANLSMTGSFSRRVRDSAVRPNYDRYIPPKHGVLRISIIDGFTQKESYRVISQGDRGNIMQIAQQSGDVLQMTSFGVQNYKIRYAEGLGFVQTMSRENANKISILVTILPHMASPVDARQLVNKVLNCNKVDINRLKREIGQAYKVIMGQPDGYYNLDLTQSMDRFCLTRLLEMSMTRAHLRSARYGSVLGYGRLGDTSQKGNWSCFRNELHSKKPVVLSISFASPLPKTGRVEFDFVSLQRVQPDNFILNDVRFTNLLVKAFLLRSSDRFKALGVLKKVKHQCTRCLHGDGKTLYETPKDKAMEIGLHLSAFYANVSERTDQIDRFKAKENLKVSWEYDPDIIQLNLSNLHEIYTIPSIFAQAESAKPSSAKADGSKLVKAINKMRLVSAVMRPGSPLATAMGFATAGTVDGDDGASQFSVDALSLPSHLSSTSRHTELHHTQDEISEVVHKLDKTKYVAGPEETIDPMEENYEISSESDDDDDDDIDADYLADTRAPTTRLGSAGVTAHIDLDSPRTAPGPPISSPGTSHPNSLANAAVSGKGRGGSMLSSMFGGGSSKRNNSSAGVAPPAPAVPQYSATLLREAPASTKTHTTLADNVESALEHTFYVKSLPPDKHPFSESHNRYLCLMASRNIPAYAKAAKMLEVLVDVFEYSFLYSRHLEMIMLTFEEFGKLKVSENYGTYRVELFVLLFSNIVDVHNIELVLRRLTAFEVACIIGRIGILNIFNPMKPEGSYELDLSRRDDRMVVKMLAQLSVVEPGDNLPFLAFQWEREMDYMPGYELTELWMTEDGLPNKGLWVATYYSGEGLNKRGCKPVTKFRKALCQLVLVDEEDFAPDKVREDDILPPIYGPSVIHANLGPWVGYFAYNEAEYKAYKDRKAQQQDSSKSSKSRK